MFLNWMAVRLHSPASASRGWWLTTVCARAAGAGIN